MDEYLTISEVAARLKYKPDTVREKMRSGIFVQGVHYFNRKGMRPLFKWSAVVAWVECTDSKRDQKTEPSDGEKIWMRRGYYLGSG